MTERFIGVDPGPEQSAYVEYVVVGGHERRLGAREIVANDRLLQMIEHRMPPFNVPDEEMNETSEVVFEQIYMGGMPAGLETFETVFWTGLFAHACRDVVRPEQSLRWIRLKRHVVKVQICQNTRANDSTIRQALIDRFGGSSAIRGAGTKKKPQTPGPLYGIKSHLWAALALAVTQAEKTLGTVPEFA